MFTTGEILKEKGIIKDKSIFVRKPQELENILKEISYE